VGFVLFIIGYWWGSCCSLSVIGGVRVVSLSVIGGVRVAHL
jgi:hypothetical protein